MYQTSPDECLHLAQAPARSLSDGMLRDGSPLIGLGGDLGRLLGGAGGFKEGPQSPASPFGQPSADWLKSDPDNVEQAMLQVATDAPKT